MTPKFEAAIAVIQLLSSTERQQLLQILTQNNSFSNSQPDFTTPSTQFLEGTTLKRLLANYSPTTVNNLKDLAADFWTEEDSIEDFLTFVRQQHQEAI
jgi:hypothetical protein